MRLAGIKRLFRWQRAILILGALGSLCVSDSAGPRLLPLPNPKTAEAAVSLSAADLASPAPRSSERTAHMAMIAGLHYRARDRQHHIQPATLAPEQLSNVPPTESQSVRQLDDAANPKAAFLSIPKGRAPPRLA